MPAWPAVKLEVVSSGKDQASGPQFVWLCGFAAGFWRNEPPGSLFSIGNALAE